MTEDGQPMTEERTWDEFRAAGLLWWVNRGLHLFGWAIVVEIGDDGKDRIYPARCKFRGFAPEAEERGFGRLRKWLEAESPDLVRRLDTE